ncbi:hypothetical protein [Olsenella sp. oral taxon 809]|uniref:hypothetical protein n=1 Tax=Olsenella sp. oral taxon 809 TaxID=661086 RepID=UPI0002F61348|nr:hypothetical protein [Olsenella sp. oral taxon 809]
MDDVHVVRAAIAAGAGTIVTYNLKDFPDSVLRQFGVTARHPDAFLLELASSRSQVVFDALEVLVSEKRHPPRGWGEELDALRNNRLYGFASWAEAILASDDS